MMTTRMIRRALVAVIVAAPSTLAAQAVRSGTTPARAADPWAPLMRPRIHKPMPTASAITAADLMTRLYMFADDSMQGRLLGEPGNYKGVEYIAGELKRFGVEPAGDNGTYFQDVPVLQRMLDPTKLISIGGTRLNSDDFIVRDAGTELRPLDGVEVVYAGDFADTVGRMPAAAAAGKFVVVTYGGPVFQTNPPHIPSRPLVSAFYAGAAGIAVVGMENFPQSNIDAFRKPTKVARLNGASTPNPVGVVYMYVTTRAAEQLAGAPISAWRVGPTGKTISGSLAFRESAMPIPARNVIGIIRGSDPKLRNEYVAIGAHNDHIGMVSDPLQSDLTGPVPHDSDYVVNHLFRMSGADDPAPRLTEAQAAQVNAILADIRKRTNGASARLDSIFNGADDDGTGSMSVLELAQYFAAQPVKPKRSLIFVWHVGEEWGLYGSQWFTDHPTVPRDSIVAQLNMDMVGRGATTDITGYKLGGQERLHGGAGYVQSVGARRLSTELGNLAESVNKTGRHGLHFDYSIDANNHQQQIYCRSDHYSYARYGIPIIFFTTGGHADYHQVTDEPQYIDYAHMAQIGNFVADLAKHVANLDHRVVVDHPKPDPQGACKQ